MNEAEEKILSFLPKSGMSFNAIVYMFREIDDWILLKHQAEHIVWESIKKLIMNKMVVIKNNKDWPLLYCKV